jgi:hypothetical protein
MWSIESSQPRTVPNGVLPLLGSPVVFVSSSGKSAQPVAGTAAKCVASPEEPAPTRVSAPPGPEAESSLPVLSVVSS